MGLFLQGLGKEKVLELLQSKNDAFRYRFLEFLEPLIEKNVLEEFKHIDDLKQEDIKKFFLFIVDIVLQSIQKVD